MKLTKIALFILLFHILGCGQKSALYLPEESPAQQPEEVADSHGPAY